MTVKKYFFPIYADKKEINKAKYDKEIEVLEKNENKESIFKWHRRNVILF